MDKSKIYIATYECELVQENKTVFSQECSCISFELLGTSEAMLDKLIPVTDSKIREFNEMPYVTINKNYSVVFDSTDTDQRLLVTRTYYKEV